MGKQNNRISARLNIKQRQAIEERIAGGEHKSLSGFLRGAIEEALRSSAKVDEMTK